MLHPRIVQLTAGLRRWVVATILAGLLITATYIGQGILAALALGRIFDGESLSAVLPYLAGIAVLVALRATILWARELTAHATAAEVKRVLRRRLYEHLVVLGPGYIQRMRTGTVQSSIGEGVEAIEAYVGKYVPQAFVAIVGPIVLLVYIATYSPLIAGLLLACLALVPFSRQITDALLGPRGREHWAAYQSMNSRFVDSMQGMETLKAFDLAGRQREELQSEAWRVYRTTMRQLAISMVGSGIIAFAQTGGVALAVGVGAVLLATDNLSLAGLLVVLFLSRECFRPFTELNEYWHLGYRGQTAADGIFEMLDASPDVSDTGKSTIELDAPPAVSFEAVTFGYQNGERPALRDVSFSISPGETVAVVGRSGAGKSTLVALLLRFFDAAEGRVLINGTDVRDLPLEHLRALSAVVWQDTYLFEGSVEENLRLARPDAAQEEIRAAAAAANAHDFIEALPEGYATILGERGATLSGGERQRIAIARALLKDAPLLILDEATSSVDAASEAAIQEALDRLIRDRTTLVIAHRLSTVANADRIVVLEDGRVVEDGAPGELRRADAHYARLVAAQERY